jgi:hypothetical protein
MCIMKHVDVTLPNIESIEDLVDFQAYDQSIIVDLPKISARMVFKLKATPPTQDFWGNQELAIKSDSGKMFLANDGTPQHWYLTCGGPGSCGVCLDEYLDNGIKVMSMKCNAPTRYTREIRQMLMSYGNIKHLAITPG